MFNLMKASLFLVISYVIFLPCFCYGHDITGREVAQKIYDRYIGDNSMSKVSMILVDKKGRKRERKFVSIFMEKNSLRKNFIRFLEPEDIAGTGFLSIEDKDGKTTQFLYLPALRRTRRIVSSQKGRSFVNSDFTYEDMERRRVDEFDHRIVGEKKIGDKECFILESVPKSHTITKYSLIRSYVPKNIYLSIKTEFYNKRNELYKILTVEKLKKIQGIWTPMLIVMENLKRKHKTILKVQEIKYNIPGIGDELFTKRNLENW